jgi:hypothetical protein
LVGWLVGGVVVVVVTEEVVLRCTFCGVRFVVVFGS